MPTLEENVNRVKAAKTAIGSAITAKGGTVGANDGLEDFAADISTIPSGGGGSSQPRKDVNFYGYDGTIVNSYTAAEFAELSALPNNPSHEGLTAQGWNWSLSDAKSYVASYGKLEIGQMYITSDGKTRLYITLTEGRLSPILRLYLNANSELDIDWGDGSTHSTFVTTTADYVRETHNYAYAGNYVIAITVVAGSFEFKSYSSDASTIISAGYYVSSSPDTAYRNSLKKIEIGADMNSIDASAFKNCYSLATITIPNSVIKIGNDAFNGCYSLNAFIIPNSVINEIGSNALGYCTSLRAVTIPNTISDMSNNIFQGCSVLDTITIPNTIATIQGSWFYNCYSITTITIPNSITQINSNAFYYCTALSAITIPSSVTNIGSGAFRGCYSLAKITIDKAEGSISGSPWGASTSSPTSTQIIWTG